MRASFVMKSSRIERRVEILVYSFSTNFMRRRRRDGESAGKCRNKLTKIPIRCSAASLSGYTQISLHFCEMTEKVGEGVVIGR